MAQIAARMGFAVYKKALALFGGLHFLVFLGVVTDSGFFEVVAVLAALLLAFASFRLRSRIRELFSIPGSTAEDVATTVCCGLCSLAQIATHVESYKPGSCSFGACDTLEGYTLS